MSKPLKPCPFCGGLNLEFDGHEGAIVCLNCAATGPFGFKKNTNIKKNASVRWNAWLEPWIAVTDELPDADLEVLIANHAWDEPVCVGFLDGHFWVRVIAPSVPLDGLDCAGGFNAHMLEPTHWMPMPDPPFVPSSRRVKRSKKEAVK